MIIEIIRIVGFILWVIAVVFFMGFVYPDIIADKVIEKLKNKDK
jgi:hypothetical protein